jgi:D-alanine-D-alanine ligase
MTRQMSSGTALQHKRLGVVMGGLSTERDVSLRSGAAMAAALQRLGCTVVSIEADRGLAGELVRSRIEVAVLALHGPLGEDGTVQGLLELLGIPYTGSGVLASALAMHKAAAKKIFAFHGLPTPAFEVLPARDAGATDAAARIGMQPPFVVKPCEGGSSIGTGIVREASRLDKALRAATAADGGDILIEAYVQGRELTVGVLNGRALPAIEVCARDGFYDYQAKYHSGGSTRYIERPDLNADLHARLQSLAERAYSALG